MTEEVSKDKVAGFSFGFTKKKEQKKLQIGAISEDVQEEKDQKAFLASFDGKKIENGDKPKEIVIPLIQNNRWYKPQRPDELEDTECDKNTPSRKPKVLLDGTAKDDLEKQAVQELCEEAAARECEEELDGEDKYRNVNIPLLMVNKVPDGFETDEKLDVSLRPEEASAADYEAIPIEAFGKAMLRGMGWREGQGLGKKGQVIKPIDAVLRPKGMGLGADRRAGQKGQVGKFLEENSQQTKEDLQMKKGTNCMVLAGKHADLYGTIEGIDEDNARAVVKLSLSGELVTLSQYGVQLVSKKEYNKYSKYLNKGKADKYREEQEGRSKKDRERDDEDSRKRKHEKDRDSYSERRKHKHMRDSSPDSRHKDTDKQKDKKHKHSHRDDSHENKHKKSSSVTNGSSGSKMKSWIWPHLRVRVVDPEYKKGKYYKCKVTIEDVIARNECICKTDEGKLLEGLSQSMLETVIPKSDSSLVMIVSGSNSGQLGEVLKRDKSSCTALVQMLKDREELHKLDYDSICEYTGDIDDQYDY